MVSRLQGLKFIVEEHSGTKLLSFVVIKHIRGIVLEKKGQKTRYITQGMPPNIAKSALH